MLKSHIFLSSPGIKIVSSIALPDAIMERIRALWLESKAKHPTLFDGPIYTVIDLSSEQLLIAPSTYSHLLAARQDPIVKQSMTMRPLAVTGILTCAGGLVFGRRGANVTDAPGLWELVPSGSVDGHEDGGWPNDDNDDGSAHRKRPDDGNRPNDVNRPDLDLSTQILRELHEEIGLPLDQVVSHPALGAIEDLESGIIDVVLPLFTKLTATEIATVHAASGSDEYKTLEITAHPHKFADNHQDLLPATRAILEAFVRR